MTTHDLSQRRACGLIGITRRGLKRAPTEDRNRKLRQRLRELAEQRTALGLPDALPDAAPRGVAAPTTNESSGSTAKKDFHCADGAGASG